MAHSSVFASFVGSMAHHALLAVAPFLAVTVCIFPAASAANAQSVALGEYLSSECVTCHQLSGRSNDGIPAIVGWPVDQFIAVLNSYRAKEREGDVMQAIAGRLSDTDIAALAAYFATVKAKHSFSSPNGPERPPYEGRK
jgi:cytochrome c553